MINDTLREKEENEWNFRSDERTKGNIEVNK